MPCRTILRNSYAKLSGHFLKLCVHVPDKLRSSLGSDFFSPPPISLTVPFNYGLAGSSSSSSRPHSAPPSPSPSPGSNRRGSGRSPLILQALSVPNSPLPPDSSLGSPRASVSLSHSNGVDEKASDHADGATDSTEDDATDTNPDEADDDIDVDNSKPATSSPNNDIAEPKSNPAKLFLLLNNVRDQNGLGSPRAPCVPPATGAPPPTSSTDPKVTSALISGHSHVAPSPLVIPPHSNHPTPHPPTPPRTPGTPRLGATTGSRPSTPRDCVPAFFSRPTTPIASSNSIPTFPSFPLQQSSSTSTLTPSSSTPSPSAPFSSTPSPSTPSSSNPSSTPSLTSSSSVPSLTSSSSSSVPSLTSSSASSVPSLTSSAPVPSLASSFSSSSSEPSPLRSSSFSSSFSFESNPANENNTWRQSRRTSNATITFTTRPPTGPVPQVFFVYLFCIFCYSHSSGC